MQEPSASKITVILRCQQSLAIPAFWRTTAKDRHNIIPGTNGKGHRRFVIACSKMILAKPRATFKQFQTGRSILQWNLNLTCVMVCCSHIIGSRQVNAGGGWVAGNRWRHREKRIGKAMCRPPTKFEIFAHCWVAKRWQKKMVYERGRRFK